MREFLKRLFAVIGVLSTITFLSSVYMVSHWLHAKKEETKPPEKMVLALDFDNPVVESVNDFTLSLPKLLYNQKQEEMPLLYILRALENARTDPKVKGVVARFGSEHPNLAHVQEIAAALDKFRESGKFSYVYAPSYGDFAPGGGATYYLASHFENIWMQPVGAVGLYPLLIEAPFGKTALSKLGVETDFLRREEYKSVMENVARDSFSPPVKANMQSMLDSLNDQMAKGIAAGRKFDVAKTRSLIAAGPFTTQESLKNNLVTKLAYADEFDAEIEKVGGKEAELVDPQTYLYYLGQTLKDAPKAKIAMIYADGMIVDNQPKGPSRLAEEDIINTADVVDGFESAAKDKDIKAIIFRVNSPGGSPVASETIRRALIKAKESKKPVYVSMGHVAASGGYWISMNGDKIFADPSTITGSIGVVAGKFVLGGLFEKLGIKWDSVGAAGVDNMWSSRTPFTEKGRARMNTMLDETYGAFTKNVAEARKIPLEKMAEIAKGRVYTGEQALTVGLVDQVGGLNAVVDALRAELKLKPEERVSFYQYPAPDTPSSLILRILHNLGLSSMVFSDLDALRQIKVALRPYIQSLAENNSVSAKLPALFKVEGL